MKTNTSRLFRQAFLLIGAFLMISIISCKEELTPNPIASFQTAISQTNFLEVTFTNYSQHATSYNWNFGDGETSTDKDPVHIYAAAGNYTVALTAKNIENAEHTYTQTITITDPNEALTLLAGSVSKTWRLYRVGASMGVGPNLENAYSWFSLQNNGSRPCVYHHEFIFHRNGDYVFDDKGMFWGEGLESGPMCIEAIAANMVNTNGVDVSAWLGGTHQFEYVPSTGMVTLTGLGAWIGLPKVATEGEVTVPQTSVSFKISIEEFDGYDLMNVQFIYEWGVWVFNYASYSNASLEPAVVSFFVDFSFSVEGRTVTFENKSMDAVSYSWDFGDGNTSTEENPIHTYAEDGTYTVVLTGTSAGGDSKEATKNVIIDTNTPTDVATAPTEPAENVISIYSDAYTSITGVNLDPDWGQSTVTEEIEIAGEMVLKMAGLTYQGIDWAGNPQNVSSKTKLHVDVWCSAVTSVNISLIGGGAENPVTITTEVGVWKSIDILLSDYTAPNLTEIIQVKFDDAGTGTSPTIFVDNIYFY